MRGLARWVAVVAGAGVALAGCVFPQPPPGAPVPALVATVPGVGTVAGTVDVAVRADHFTPSSVSIWADSTSGPPVATDAAAPFLLPVDTSGLADGGHTFWVKGASAEYTVVGVLSVAVDNRSYDWSAVDAAMAAKLEVPVPGAAVRVAHHGAVVYEETVGTYTPNTVVRIASASKWLSAATIMTLVDDGTLSLDAPISQYLPAFTGAKAAITLRQLLSFTSGLDEDPWCTGSATLTLQECADVIAGLPLRAPPGAQYRYGNGHLAVAAAIAEVTTGTPWVTLFSQQIAQPLGMTSTFFVGGSNPNPAGGARSTLNNYERFVRAMWNYGELAGVRVLSRGAVEEMQQDQTNGAPIVVASAIRKALGSRYGLGEWYDVLDASSGAYEVSSPGAFGFHPWIDRERDVYGVYVVEHDAGDGEGLMAGGWDVKSHVRTAVDQSD